MFPKRKIYIINCSTGCSCCACENHQRGPFPDMPSAERREKKFRSMPLLASQYSKTGRYHIYEYEAEELPDGRVICENDCYEKLFEVDENGNLSEETEDKDRIND